MAEFAGGPKPSVQELAALEQSFSQDPTSQAYLPLAEAYLALGRFMEAMVVAKKGARARTTEAAPRALLARIYAEQGKDPKALEELTAALLAQPQDLPSLKLQARLLFKTGQKTPGAEALLKALAVAPTDPEVTQLMAKFGVQPPTPPPPTARDSPPDRVLSASVGATRVARPLEPGGLPGARPPAYGQSVALELARLADEEERLLDAKKRAGGPRLLLTISLVVVGGVLLIGWALYAKFVNQRNHEIAALLKKTQESLAHDSYASYQEAEKSAQRALELDQANFAAAAYLAYINALRYGENGEGEDFLHRAQEYLTAAKAQKQPHAYIFAAEAYLDLFLHQPEKAEAELNEILNRKDPLGGKLYRSNLLSGALGIVQLQEGKLSEARKNLVEAHDLAQADVRVTAALGTVDSRLNSAGTAEAFFSTALRIDADHVPSLLGLAQLELESDPPDAPAAERLLAHLAALGNGALSPRQSAYAKFVHAQLLYAQNKTAQATDEEKVAFALDPKNPEMLLVAGRRLRRAGQPEKAITLVRQAIDLDPNRGSFYAELGEAYLAVPNGAASATQFLTQAISRVPPNARLMTLLAEAYRKQADLAHAQEQWLRALKLEPDNVDAHLGLARFYLEKGDQARAQAEYELVAKHAQGATLAEADTERGRAALDRGDPTKAKELFASALGADREYPPPYFYLGKLLSADRGKRSQARELLGEYLKRAPGGALASEATRLLP